MNRAARLSLSLLLLLELPFHTMSIGLHVCEFFHLRLQRLYTLLVLLPLLLRPRVEKRMRHLLLIRLPGHQARLDRFGGGSRTQIRHCVRVLNADDLHGVVCVVDRVIGVQLVSVDSGDDFSLLRLLCLHVVAEG